MRMRLKAKAAASAKANHVHARRELVQLMGDIRDSVHLGNDDLNMPWADFVAMLNSVLHFARSARDICAIQVAHVEHAKKYYAFGMTRDEFTAVFPNLTPEMESVDGMCVINTLVIMKDDPLYSIPSTRALLTDAGETASYARKWCYGLAVIDVRQLQEFVTRDISTKEILV